MSKSKVPFVLLVDDEPDHLRLLCDILGPVNCQLATASNARDAQDLCQQEQFALGIVDVRLPDMSGLELIPQLRALNPEMGFILITAFAQVSEAISAVRDLRAFAYIEKPFSPYNVRQRVADCLVELGHSRWPSIGDLVVKPEEQLVEQGGKKVPLSGIEAEVLSFLIRQGGRTATYEELFENVWRSDLTVGYADTIQDTVRRLQEKLGDDPQNSQYIQLVPGVGYRALDWN